MKKPITIKLESDQLAWLKSHASALRRTATSIIEEALDDFRAKLDPKPKKKA